MKKVYLALNWIFGGIFLLMGLVLLASSPLAGLCLMGIALLLLPSVRNLVYSKTNKAIPIKVRVVTMIALLIACSVFAMEDSKKQDIVHFKANREQIISSVKAALAAKEYQSVILQSSKYLLTRDKELEQLNVQAKRDLAAIQKGQKTEELLSKLKSVPTKEYEKNMNLYQQLVNLNPGNETYQKKVSFYEEKIEEVEEKELEESWRQRQEQNLARREAESRRLGLTWQYRESADKMGRGKIKNATVNSLNQVEFDSPYRGPQRATLQLRNHPKYGRDVILSIERGQFLCSYDECNVQVRFGTGKPVTFSVSEPADHSTTVLFINDYARFVLKAKKANKVSVEAQFFQEGTRVFEFDIAGLKWL